MRRLLLLLLLLSSAAFGGESFRVGQPFVYNFSVPKTPTNRLEFYMHDWTPSSVIHVVSSGATGWTIIMYADGSIRFYNAWITAGGFEDSINLSTLAVKGAYFRCQLDAAKKLQMVEAWDVNGNRIYFHSTSYTAANPNGNGIQLGWGGEQPRSMGFLRIHTSLVPVNSRTPVTVDDKDRLLEWKFDGNLRDASPNRYNGSVGGGSEAYTPTPNQNVIAVLKTANAPSWTNVVSQRAGYPAVLDGSASYSQSDQGSNPSFFWQQISGPSQSIFSSRTTPTTTVTGLVFGDYLYRLTVTDSSGKTSTATADVGAVATDDNGVVVNADPRVDALFGNMIAFGKNPWGYADYWSQHAMQLRASDYETSGWSALQWEQTGQGTVSYYFNGVGWYMGNTKLGTKTTASVSATDTTIKVTDASKLDLAELPARIFLLNLTGLVREEIRICSVSGNTLTVCYDGRGQNPLAFASGASVTQNKVAGTGTKFLTDPKSAICPVGAPGPPGPASFTGGSIHLTAGSKIATGTGTHWLSTDANTHSSAGQYVRVAATHGGTPFTFIAVNQTGGAFAGIAMNAGKITGVNILYGLSGQNYTSGQVNVVITDKTGSGANVLANVLNGAISSFTVISGGSNYSAPTINIEPMQIQLNRVFPADADTADYSGYAFLPANRTIVLRATHAADPSGYGEVMFGTAGCESETSAYLNLDDPGTSFSGGHDVGGVNGTRQPPTGGFPYSVTDTNGWVNAGATGGISFYGESLASRALYYRSGLTSAKKAADILDDYLIKSPWANADVAGGSPLFKGGLAIAGFASHILSNNKDWSDLRSYAASGETIINQVYNNGGAPVCQYFDTRDTGYSYTFVILAALYDPDPAFRARWLKALTKMQANDTACKGSDGSWSNSAYWNFTTGPLTMTNGSATVTGVNIPQSACLGVTSGTGTVTAGSGTITITGGAVPTNGSAVMLVINGTSGGKRFTGSYSYSVTGNVVTLAVLWPGDSGNVTWTAAHTNGGAMTGFATASSDVKNLAYNYVCTWNSPTSITLDHPWLGTSGSAFYGRTDVLVGFGQQPFMLGIKAYGMGKLAASTDPALASYAKAYGAMNRQALQWIHDKGVDAATLTTNYGRGFEFCEPTTTSTNKAFDQRTPGCNFGMSLGGRAVGREQNQELGNAISDYYIYNPTPENKTWGDQLYGAVWGHPNYNTDGVFYDEASDALNVNLTNLLDSYIHAGKWYGFFAGMGMLHRWPAVRLGGVAPPDPVTMQIPFALESIPNAAKVQITLTAPTGAVTSVTCTAAPCAVTVDRRIGSPLMKLDYLNAAGAVIAPGDTVPLAISK